MRPLTQNTLILIINNIGGSGLSFLISVLVGRSLGTVGLGQYTFVIAWVLPLTMLTDFGLATLITRDVARDKAAALGILQTANRVLPIIAGGVLLATWGVLLIAGLSPIVTASIAIAAFLVILDPWYGIYMALFRAFERMSPVLFINVGGLFIQLALTVLAIAGRAGLVGVVAALIAVNTGQLAVTWLWWRRSPLRASEALQPAPTVRVLIQQAAPFALAAVIGALSLRLNIFLIERLADDSSVGLYSAASRFVEAGRLLPNAFFGALFPALAGLSTRPAELNHLLWRAARSLGGLSVALALGLTIAAPFLLGRIYGPAFVAGSPALIVLAWALIPSILHALLNIYFYSLRQEALVNRISIVALVAQAGIGGLFVVRWGATGAALAVLVVECATLLYMVAMLHQTRPTANG